MADKRLFLGWDQAVLPAAAAWLVGRHGFDLGGVIVAVPAGRAGRRLEELLADAAATQRQVLVPPTIVTAGQLPEHLFTLDDDPPDPLTATLTRAATLREADRTVLERVVPHPPEAGDAVGWFRLAEQLGRLSEELASARLTPAHVASTAAKRGIDLGLSEARWDALAQLDEAYRQRLNRPDRQAARQQAIVNKKIECDHAVVLVGLVDLSAQLAGMLLLLNDVTPLVPAPASHAAGFDALGGLLVEYWQDQPIDLADLRLADQPRDQAIELVRVLSELPPDTAAEDVTVGLGDEDAAGALGRAIELAGTPARPAAGRLVSHSAPAVLLDSLGRYAARWQFADLAALVRHPDLRHVVGDEPWIALLDDYAAQYLQADTLGPWRGDDEKRDQLNQLTDRLHALLPEQHDTPQPLPTWSPAIAQLLAVVYGHRELNRFTDHATVVALTQLAKTLGEQAQLDPDASATPRLTFAQTVSLTLGRLAGQRLPEPGGTPAVELLGFLELPWDDAAHVVLTDVNEGHIPDSRNADAFLPDGLRRALGLADNARRYARDVLLMNIVLNTRPRGGAVVLACRRSAEGDPKVPSRLLLACDEATRIERVKAFYAEGQEKVSETSGGTMLLAPGGRSRFLIPRPLMDAPTLDRLPVTAFRDYLACKYRFYLKHVARLGSLDDRAAEMDPLAFGSLAHGVLEDFGKSPLADATDAAVIDAFLSERLDAHAGGRFGRSPRPAVRVQVEQLRPRLSRFADTQAAEARNGWRIRTDLIEKRREAVITLDGQPFTVVGTIDRIDHHPDHGFRVLDYKTSDTATPPDKTHRKQGEWVDLQLPLYRTLLEPMGITVGPSAMGYINLSKSAESKASAVVLAEWTEADLAEADAVRDAVIRGVRGNVFWPPSEDPPTYDDAFTRLAADRALDRETMIHRGGPA